MAAICATTLTGAWMRGAAAQARDQQRANAMKIYLAGPLGFSEAGRAYYKSDILGRITGPDYVRFDPWGDDPPPGIAPQLAGEIMRLAAETKAADAMQYGPAKKAVWEKLNRRLGAKNRALIDECDVVFAILDGTDVDSGTAAEIGYAFAKGKPILGYRGDFRLSADNDGATVNLQVEYFIDASGGKIIRHIADLEGALAKLKH
jgi:nucleoside 2-deoxyribosyltransferase